MLRTNEWPNSGKSCYPPINHGLFWMQDYPIEFRLIRGTLAMHNFRLITRLQSMTVENSICSREYHRFW